MVTWTRHTCCADAMSFQAMFAEALLAVLMARGSPVSKCGEGGRWPNSKDEFRYKFVKPVRVVAMRVRCHASRMRLSQRKTVANLNPINSSFNRPSIRRSIPIRHSILVQYRLRLLFTLWNKVAYFNKPLVANMAMDR